MADPLEERIARLEAQVAALASVVISESSGTQLTPYAREVGRVVARIPFGETSTYAEVAKQAGAPGSYRSVGSALTTVVRAGIPVPWWRVVPASGVIDGPFAEERRLLLAAEGHPPATTD